MYMTDYMTACTPRLLEGWRGWGEVSLVHVYSIKACVRRERCEMGEIRVENSIKVEAGGRGMAAVGYKRTGGRVHAIDQRRPLV